MDVQNKFQRVQQKLRARAFELRFLLFLEKFNFTSIFEYQHATNYLLPFEITSVKKYNNIKMLTYKFQFICEKIVFQEN